LTRIIFYYFETEDLSVVKVATKMLMMKLSEQLMHEMLWLINHFQLVCFAKLGRLGDRWICHDIMVWTENSV
jgi:hypothetical protein